MDTVIDLNTALTTDQAAQELGVTPSQLRAFLGKHKQLQPAKFGNVLIFTHANINDIAQAMKYDADGCCPNCGYELRGPRKAQKPKPVHEDQDVTQEDLEDEG